MSQKRTRKQLEERKLPFDPQAELALLGSVILNFDCLDDVSQQIVAADFVDEAHQKLYRHLLRMHEEGRRFDIALLRDRLITSGELEAIGGTAYLAKVINMVPNAAHAIYYAEIIRAHSLGRKLIDACQRSVDRSFDPSTDQQENLAATEADLARISDSTIFGGDTREFRAILHEAIDALEARIAGGDNGILDVGLTAMRSCMGLVRGGLTILGGRPSNGKTAAAVSMIRHVARRGGSVYFATLEMSAIELTDRILSGESQIDYYKMKTGRQFQTEHRQRIVEAASEISQWALDFDDRPSMTVSQIGAAARRVKRKRNNNLDLLVIDYLQLVEPAEAKEDRVEQLAKISRATKRLARELNTRVLALAQVNRSATDNADNRPRLHQLKGCGDFEQDADSVAFVHRPAWYNREKPGEGNAEVAEIILEKNRNGPTDIFKVSFWREWMEWGDPATQQQEANSGREWHP